MKKPGAVETKPEWTAGGQIEIKLSECPLHIYLFAWDALRKEKDEKNRQSMGGKISKYICDASVAKIDEESQLVLSKLSEDGLPRTGEDGG